MTAIPYAIRAAMFSPSSAEGIVALIEINKPEFVAPYRFTGYAREILSEDPFRQGLVHLGEEYTYAVVSAGRPDDLPGESGSIPLTLENVEQDLGALAKASVNEMTVTLTHVALSDPDVIIEQFEVFQTLSCAASEDGTVALTVSKDPMDDEPGTMVRFTADQFGSLFP